MLNVFTTNFYLQIFYESQILKAVYVAMIDIQSAVSLVIAYYRTIYSLVSPYLAHLIPPQGATARLYVTLGTLKNLTDALRVSTWLVCDLQ